MMKAFLTLTLFIAVLTMTPGGSAHAARSEGREAKTTAPKKWDFFAHYKMRLEQIERDIAQLPPETTQTIVLLGDSITEGFRIRELAGMRVVNMGISGDQIAMGRPDGGVRSRVGLLAKARPAHVFLLIGINDLGSSKPLDVMKREYEALVKDIRATVPQAQLHLQSLLPTRGYFAMHNANVRAMNEFLRALALREGLDYIDVASVMSDERGQLRADWTGDGLHLLAPAYEAWRGVLEGRLASKPGR